MPIVKNYDSLVSNEQRKIALSLVEAAFDSITPQKIFEKGFSLDENTLKIQEQTFDLSHFERILVVGFGKGSAEMCRIIENVLGDKLTIGFDIDVVDETPFKKIQYTKGTHPLPSEINIEYTNNVLKELTGVTEKDLILVVICGGGSVMFEAPSKVDLPKLRNIVDAMLKSGADITEMNVIRKHLSKVKGGGLAHLLYPATIASLIFSDVPGNDLSVIASGTTVKDHSTRDEVKQILEKYNVNDHVQTSPDDFVETETDDKYFEKVHNILMLSNLTAIHAMEEKAKEYGLTPRTYTDRLQGDARTMGQQLLSEAKAGEVLLAGGETTIKVTGRGLGGRNQALALCSLPYITPDTLLVSFSTDGWDFYWFAGALVDSDTQKKVSEAHIDVLEYLRDDNSYGFWEHIGDGIKTGKQESNVSDLYIVIKK